VRAAHFEKFLEDIFLWPHLGPEVAFSSRYALLARVTDFFITTVVAGYYGGAMGLLLLPFLATLGTFPGALNGLGWCNSATSSGHIRVA
jgi:hypothetical protein